MSNSFFNIEMLPARQGDALWIEYGRGKIRRRILIDGGPIAAYSSLSGKLNELPEGDKRIELIVITHVDTDHIEGIIRQFAEKRLNWPILPKDIWFNGWRHLTKSDLLGGREGDFLSALISRRAFDEWNHAFDRKAVVVDPNKPLPVKILREGMQLTLLSPTPGKLEEMAAKWTKDVEKHGLDPGDLDSAWKQLVEKTKFHPEEGLLGGPKDFEEKLKNQLKTDQSDANGSSIAFLAEFDGKSCLFLADAHKDIICQSLEKLIPRGKKRLKVNAVKVSHHGSRANISEELMNLVDAEHFLISTNSAIYRHPNNPAIEAIIHWSLHKPILWFNYRTKQTSPWEVKKGDHGRSFSTRFPKEGESGIVVKL